MKINIERIILIILLLCTFRIIFGFSSQNSTESSGVSRKITIMITKNIKVSVTEFVTGSYANILKIKTDKTNYDGDSIEKYYKVLDENNKEIITCSEEEKQYEEAIYNDRIITEKINKNSYLYPKTFKFKFKFHTPISAIAEK